MSVFDKLFSLKRRLDSVRDPRNRDRSCQINSEQVRLLLFKECDWKGRKLLFDSSAIQKVPSGKNDKPNKQTDQVPCVVEVSDGFTYVYKGPEADANVLGEMIFGAVAMNCKNVSLKIHFMDEPRRLMCAKVFGLPRCRKQSRVDKPEDRAGARDLKNSRAELKNLGSRPLSVPQLREEGVSLSFSMDKGDSGFYGENSTGSSVGSTYDYFSMFESWEGREDCYSFDSLPGRKLSTSSNDSWHRRTFQNMATRFELGQHSSHLLSVPTATSYVNSSDSQIYSNSSASGTSESIASGSSSMVQMRIKLGLALLITVSDSAEMDIVRRCIEHSPQLQSLVCRLRLATLAAGASGGFVSTLHRASEDAARWLSDLIYGPRLQPMWLTLVASQPRACTKLADSLLADLCSVLTVGDTKNTNFFISTLLTHVLTYHLGWVTTVSPYDSTHQQPPEPRPRPYNALWAQLGDLCGSIGFPPRSARTIVSGASNAQFINRLLIVLTYFVRCGEVRRADYHFQDSAVTVIRTVSVGSEVESGKSSVRDCNECMLKVPVNTQDSDISVSTLAPSEVSLKRSSTLADLNRTLSTGDSSGEKSSAPSGLLRRNPTMLLSMKASSDSSLNSSVSEEFEPEQKVVFVLGDDEKLVGLKNKSTNGKSVKRSSKTPNEPLSPQEDVCNESRCDSKPESPSKCCAQTLQHSKPIKHSGFKFEFDKYPQIVTNYMKSKNLEILDRHYIGKPGNLKMDNFQFDPTVVQPIQEERCDTCMQCQTMESTLQTPTNASEMEYMNDMPRLSEPQYAKATVEETRSHRELSPKTFVRKHKENTLLVNVAPSPAEREKHRRTVRVREGDKTVEVRRVVEFPMPPLGPPSSAGGAGFDESLLGGVTDHYVPDLVLQGTLAHPHTWEMELRRDLDVTSYLNKRLDTTIQAVAIVGDTNSWEVRVVGRDCGSGGMSSLVGAMLDAVPAMCRAKVPAHQCLSFLEGKLREFCILSKTLADLLMSTDFCDISTLTKTLDIDVNDVPLLLAVATTHTPQVATRYGISYR